MVYFEDAIVLDALKLKEMIDSHHDNPTVDNMVFLELKVKDGKQSMVFPCFMEAWTEDNSRVLNGDLGRKPLLFQCTVILHKDEAYTALRIFMHEEEFEVRKRVWDKPPVESLRKYLPFVDGILQ